MTDGIAFRIEKTFAGRGGCFSFRAAGRLARGQVSGCCGPSGSGKTTLLRAIAGLEKPEAGEIRFGDRTWFSAAESRWVLLGSDRPPSSSRTTLCSRICPCSATCATAQSTTNPPTKHSSSSAWAIFEPGDPASFRADKGRERLSRAPSPRDRKSSSSTSRSMPWTRSFDRDSPTISA